MATRAQIEANRRNSLKSTGPITPEGKAAVSRNGVRHGLFCRHLLVEAEDTAEFDAFRDGIYARLQPADELERLYAERIVSAAWRMRLAIKAEASLFDFYARVSSSHWPAEDAMRQPSPAEGLARMQKYAAALERGLDKAMAELARLQDRRRASDAANQTPNRHAEPSAAADRAAEQIISRILQNKANFRKDSRMELASQDNPTAGARGETSSFDQNKANGAGWGEISGGEDDWTRSSPALATRETRKNAVGRMF